jgi:hypothetical protein
VPQVTAQKLCAFSQYRVEHRGEVPGRGIDDLQDLGGRGLSREPLIALSGALIQPPLQLGKFAPEIGNDLVGII